MVVKLLWWPCWIRVQHSTRWIIVSVCYVVFVLFLAFLVPFSPGLSRTCLVASSVSVFLVYPLLHEAHQAWGGPEAHQREEKSPFCSLSTIAQFIPSQRSTELLIIYILMMSKCTKLSNRMRTTLTSIGPFPPLKTVLVRPSSGWRGISSNSTNQKLTPLLCALNLVGASLLLYHWSLVNSCSPVWFC